MSDSRTPLRIGTRASALAMWQARHVASRIAELPGAPPIKVVRIKTDGDRIRDVPLSSVGGKGFFTKEIEAALLDERVDLAVHSLKDLETTMPDGLAIGAVLEREDVRDVLIARAPLAAGASDLPQGARVGTSSLRRRALLARWRPDLLLVDLRGNVPTRVRKLDDGGYDAIVLAAAGVVRLGLAERISAHLPLEIMLPAVGQGAVAIQAREADTRTLEWVARLEHDVTRVATAAERSLLRELEGGCQVPVGAHAQVDGAALRLRAIVCDPTGVRSVEGSREGTTDDAEAMGRDLAGELLRGGAAEILRAIRVSVTENPS